MRNLDKLFELEERSCDALILAYDPCEVLTKAYDEIFYIPSKRVVEESFGFALRNIFGSEQGASHWADFIKWGGIKNLNKLEKRIHDGVGEATGGDHEYLNYFDTYLSMNFNPSIQYTWVYMKGDFYRFSKGKREEALDKFEKFWNEKEKSRWNEIHEFMRAYTKKEYGKKNV
jgi:hypothetical protein